MRQCANDNPSTSSSGQGEEGDDDEASSQDQRTLLLAYEELYESTIRIGINVSIDRNLSMNLDELL